MCASFYYQSIRKDLTNFAFLRQLKFSGFLVSMHQSGTHWVKYLLAVAIAREYSLPMPQYNHANDIIGGPRDPRLYDNAPRLASRHSIPHPLLNSSIFRTMVKLPRYVVLIRDIRYSLISNYEKWRNRYNCSFSEYLRGNVRGRRFNNDIWWCIRFVNAWGRLIEKYPDDHLLVKYEELNSETLTQVNRINNFWNLDIREAYLNFAIQESTKDKMRVKPKKAPRKNTNKRIAVRMDSGPNEIKFTIEDEVFFKQTCSTYLKYDFGYDYE